MEGGNELVERLEREGYDPIREEVARPCLSAAPAPSREPPARRRSTARSPAPARATRAARASCASARAPPTTRSSCRAGGARASGRPPSTISTSTRSRRTDARPDADAPGDRSATSPHAGVLVQRDASVVHVELDAGAARAQGVILCSLEEAAARPHRALRALLPAPPDARPPQARGRERGLLDAAARSSTCRPGSSIADPFQIVYEITIRRRQRPVRAHARDRRPRRRDPPARVRPRRRHFDGDALHAGQFELYLEDGARCRLAHAHRLGRGRRATTSRPRSSRSAATPTATGCRRCSAAT